MDVAVAYKWAGDPQEAIVAADGSVDFSRATAAISEYDAVAIELGVNLAVASGGGECIGISVGGAAVASSLAKKAAMSRGLDRGLLLADDRAATLPSTAQAQLLAQLVRRTGAQLVLTGDTSIDESARMMSALIAGQLGWPCFQQVSAIVTSDDAVVLTQAVGSGSRQLTVRGPLVIAVATDAISARVPGMKDILAAGRKPVVEVPFEELGLRELGLRVLAASAPPRQARKHEIFDGENAAAQLISALRGDGVI